MRMQMRSLARWALCVLVAAAASATVRGETAAQMEANKNVVLNFWHSVFDHQDISKAKDYLAPEYHQHNPTVATGLTGFEQFFGHLWPKPKAAADVKMTQFDAVIAEGDLVMVMFKTPKPDPDSAGKTYDAYWFDLFRVKNGKIVEHWDEMLKPEKPSGH